MGFTVDAASAHGSHGVEPLEVPSLEGYHNSPTVPKLFDQFIVLVLPVSATDSANKTDNCPSTRPPDSRHRSVRLSRDRPPVRIDMHGKLIQVLKDSKRFFVCKGVLFDNPVRLQPGEKNSRKQRPNTYICNSTIEILRKVRPGTITVRGTASGVVRVHRGGGFYLEELTGSSFVAAPRSLS